MVGAGAATVLVSFFIIDYMQDKLYYEEKAREAVNNNNKKDLPRSPTATLLERFKKLSRDHTAKMMHATSELSSLRSRYRVNWWRPLGEGTFGTVYSAIDRRSGERVALKKLPKKFTDDMGFTREMDALMHLREEGGHPNICGLRENFEEGRHYYLTLDLVSGGEMFEHLVQQGAYSEADASRLMREVASALTFMHGIGIIHGDLKPENLMLSTNNPSDAVIKIVDFGCAQIITDGGVGLQALMDNDRDAKEEDDVSGMIGNTPAYCAPEILDESIQTTVLEPSMDMWALGIILYIMLTGLHPFDLNGASTDEEILQRVVQHKAMPLRNSPITAHLSESAVDLIERLIQWRPEDRITAQEMLDHPWVQGLTAKRDKIENSDKRLSKHRVFKTRLEAQVFANMLKGSESSDVSKRTSLIEQSFRSLDPQQKGYISGRDLQRIDAIDGADSNAAPLSLSGFSDLLSVNMKNKHFAKGHIVYKEGDIGNHMYFINSGTIEVTTKDGSSARRGPGDFFGEGALVNPLKIRSGTIRCVTPVHAIEISREYFEKYMAASKTDSLYLNVKEKDKIRKRNRAKSLLRLQNSLTERSVKQGEYIYKQGEEGQELFIVEDGWLDVTVDDRTVFKLGPGGMCGEHSLLFTRPRNTSAVCTSNNCKLLGKCGFAVNPLFFVVGFGSLDFVFLVFLVMRQLDFYKFLDATPTARDSLQDMCKRREFQKAWVFRTKKPFPTNKNDLRIAFNVADEERTGLISLENIRSMLTTMDPTLEESDIQSILKSLKLDDSQAVTYDEFERIFGTDQAQAESI